MTQSTEKKQFPSDIPVMMISDRVTQYLMQQIGFSRESEPIVLNPEEEAQLALLTLKSHERQTVSRLVQAIFTDNPEIDEESFLSILKQANVTDPELIEHAQSDFSQLVIRHSVKPAFGPEVSAWIFSNME